MPMQTALEAIARVATLEKRLEQDRTERQDLARRQSAQEARLDDLTRRLDALDGGSFDPSRVGVGGGGVGRGLRAGERPNA